MSDTKFTPGPWRVRFSESIDGGVVLRQRDIGPRPHVNVERGGCVASVGSNFPLGTPAGIEADADAYLIAAAPDLYAALEAMFAIGTTSECHEGPCGHKACGLAKAALAKARGE